jgi:hypothetical protein
LVATGVTIGAAATYAVVLSPSDGSATTVFPRPHADPDFYQDQREKSNPAGDYYEDLYERTHHHRPPPSTVPTTSIP